MSQSRRKNVASSSSDRRLSGRALEKKEQKRREEQNEGWKTSLRPGIHGSNQIRTRSASAGKKSTKVNVREINEQREQKKKESEAGKAEWIGSLRAELQQESEKAWSNPEPETKEKHRPRERRTGQQQRNEMETLGRERKENEKQAEEDWMSSLRPASGKESGFVLDDARDSTANSRNTKNKYNAREMKNKQIRQKQERKEQEKTLGDNWTGSLRSELRDSGGFIFDVNNDNSSKNSKNVRHGKTEYGEMQKQRRGKLQAERQMKEEWATSLRDTMHDNRTGLIVEKTAEDRLQKRQAPTGKEYRRHREKKEQEQKEISDTWKGSLRPEIQD